MKRGLYAKLAVSNIRKNGKTYIPYIITCIITVMMFYMIKSLSLNPGIEKMIGADTISYIMGFGANVITLFSFIFLFYTNSFLIKQRKKEFGLFNILGMEKKHLAKVLLLETLIIALISLGSGLVFGIALDKVMFLLISKVIGGSVTLGFFISLKAIVSTVILFGIIFMVIYLKSVYTIRKTKPVELLRGGNMGEKEPKAKWLLALAGAGMLTAGYYMALTVKNPITSINIFFIAVILVITATYLLFTAGSIAVLKLMRKNQRFYYKTKHFISVSGMIYRMKQNAVGLANICILSTMVLIMVSSTTSLIVGMDDIIKARYTNDFCIYSEEQDTSRNEEFFENIEQICREEKVNITGRLTYRYAVFAACEQGDTFVSDESQINIASASGSVRILAFIPLSDYNAVVGSDCVLQPDELLFFSNSKKEYYSRPTIKFFDKEYKIAGHLSDFFGNGQVASNIATSYYCIMNDEDFEALCKTASDALRDNFYEKTYYGLDTDSYSSVQQAFFDSACSFAKDMEFNGSIESRVESRNSFIGLYGGLFFLGIFLGVLFIMVTVLIIYYKQISEGYEDRERFIIMQKVGMTKSEVKSAIRSQVLMVFFLPLLMAGIHVAAAFPLITLLLELMNMTNVHLYLTCTAICFLIFAAVYVLIYSLTARTYYRIVSIK
jgi:putative ABC transport system permease protein